MDLAIQATPYFCDITGVTRRVLAVQLPVPATGHIEVAYTFEGQTTHTAFDAVDGQGAFNGPPSCAGGELALDVRCAVGSWSVRSAVPPTRHWTIYIAQDKHLDYGWIHPVEQVVERMNLLTDYHLDAAERVGLRWNLGNSIWVEEYLRARPSARRERLLTALRSGEFEVAALWLVPFPGVPGTEEILRGLQAARELERAYGIPVRTASLQEVPSLPWGYATILAGANVPYAVKGAYDLRNPHLRERDPYPLAAWEGPDGSRVLLKWDLYAGTNEWGGYAEAYRLWRSSGDEARVRLIEDTVARYEQYEHYPFDAILLDGTGFDEYPQTTAVSDFIQRFNAEGWAYPRLVDATWGQFWEDIEHQMKSGTVKVPVVRGDWGTTWEEWPAQLAHLNSVYRRARERVVAAETLSALAYALDPGTHPIRQEALDAAWRGLLQFADHNIGGITKRMADDMRDRKATYATTAAREGGRALQGGLATLAASVRRGRGGSERRVLVANTQSWARNGLVEVMVPDPGPYDVVDLESGRTLPCQVDTRGGWPEHYLEFVAEDVPGFGYRCYGVQPGGMSTPLPDPAAAVPALENKFFRLTIDSKTGGLCSLREMLGGEELVAGRADLALNQFLFWRDGSLHRPVLVVVEGREGQLGASLTVKATCREVELRSTYRLVRGLPRLDIVNQVVKPPTDEPQCCWFAFPLDMMEHVYWYDGPAAVLRAGLQAEGGDLLPGSGRTCIAVQTFLAAASPECAVVVATPDAHLFQLGAHVLDDPLADSDPRRPVALSLAMHNFTRNDHAVDQGGQSLFEFRYSIGVQRSSFCPGRAVRFAKEAIAPLETAWVSGEPEAPLHPVRQSLLHVGPPDAIATGFKAAEDGEGWVVRLWECNGEALEATVDAGALGATRAWACDLLERVERPLPMAAGKVVLDIPARGLRAVRFQ
jgi:hypothetical protein